MSNEDAIAHASRYWNAHDRQEAHITELRQLHNAQVFIGMLPTYDIEWNGAPGYYIYVLKPRKRNGKYQVLDYKSI